MGAAVVGGSRNCGRGRPSDLQFRFNFGSWSSPRPDPAHTYLFDTYPLPTYPLVTQPYLYLPVSPCVPICSLPTLYSYPSICKRICNLLIFYPFSLCPIPHLHNTATLSNMYILAHPNILFFSHRLACVFFIIPFLQSTSSFCFHRTFLIPSFHRCLSVHAFI